jgi:type I restriction enzyme S subunit
VSDSQAAEVMSRPLAKGWQWVQLGQYVENLDGRRVPVSKKEREARQGDFPYYGASGVIDSIDGHTHDGEFVLIGEDGANLLTRSKPIAFQAKGKIWVNNHAHVLRCKPGYPNAYLAYYINSIDLSPYVTGTAQPKLSQSMMNKIPVPVAPQTQQVEIVAEIEKQFSRLDEVVANLQRVKANLKRYKAAILKAAVEGRLVETEASLAHREGRSYETGEQLLQRILEERRMKWAGKRKYREPVKPETGLLSELPTGWAWASPEQVSAGEPYSLAIGPFGSSLKVCDYKSEGVPLVFVRNIRSVTFGGENTVYVNADKAAELAAHTVEGGDILITKMGAPPGDVCRYPVNRPPAVITADCVKMRLTKVDVNPSFIEYAIASRVVQDQIFGITKGVAQLKVNLANFSSIALPLAPYVEQARIVAEVDRQFSIICEVEAEVEANLLRSKKLRRVTLMKYFSC